MALQIEKDGKLIDMNNVSLIFDANEQLAQISLVNIDHNQHYILSLLASKPKILFNNKEYLVESLQHDESDLNSFLVSVNPNFAPWE